MPTAILTHMARSALGEMLPSEKKSSRRRRKTLGKEDSGAEEETESRSEASEGTRSSMSGLKLITASSLGPYRRKDVRSARCTRPGLPRVIVQIVTLQIDQLKIDRLQIDQAHGGFCCRRHRLWRKQGKLMLARKLKEDQGNFRLSGAGVTCMLWDRQVFALPQLCKSLLTSTAQGQRDEEICVGRIDARRASLDRS